MSVGGERKDGSAGVVLLYRNESKERDRLDNDWAYQVAEGGRSGNRGKALKMGEKRSGNGTIENAGHFVGGQPGQNVRIANANCLGRPARLKHEMAAVVHAGQGVVHNVRERRRRKVMD